MVIGMRYVGKLGHAVTDAARSMGLSLASNKVVEAGMDSR